MKRMLTEGLKRIVPETIARQEKFILIDEAVRLVLDEPHRLGIILLPPVSEEDHHARKSAIKNALKDMYSKYSFSHASIGDIVTDLLEELKSANISVIAV